jgi:hypothetical protein
MARCENCNKSQKDLHACTTHSMWLCDKCYSITLNPYTAQREQMTQKQFNEWLWGVEWKTLNKGGIS